MCHHRKYEISHDAYQGLVYFCTLAMISILSLIVNIHFKATTWSNANEACLVSYVYIQLVSSVLFTVLPGRIARMNAIISSETLSLKQVFVRYVSHEIRSPLNVVHAGLDLLSDHVQKHIVGEAGKAIMELMEDISAASTTAICILDDLLNYENIDAGSFKLDLSWKPLVKNFGQNLKWVELLAARKSVNCEIIDETGCADEVSVSNHSSNTSKDECLPIPLLGSSADPELTVPVVKAFLHIDTNKIGQVIRNLITNAIKFTPANGTVTVKLTRRPTNESDEVSNNNRSQKVIGWFRFEVVDSGVGISAEQQKSVFGEFTQFNRNELQGGGGSGLGLWISRRIITLHEGVLSFSSRGLGHGSTFYFELPLYSEPADTNAENIPILLPERRESIDSNTVSSFSKLLSRKLLGVAVHPDRSFSLVSPP
eukprot:CAMPEP_0170106806 /NCGR_PEP_ID=MMETSP0020_2-20130122/5603_1 /TAXON_ID=98059 /ORGANISM="Dinobryon sp., Strain UTEXLB2267" /LENGTH=425 /DNA_ID=CAMNT_0010331223 /DNA_START=272 /DNA_END=1545 /DNA_ORIENTATION=+